MNPRELLAAIRRNPLLVVGGLVVLFVLVNLPDVLRPPAEPEPAPEPDADPDADAATYDESIGPDAAGFLTPSVPYYQYPTYDPFGTELGTGEPVARYSPEGCLLPRPTPPPGYEGRGEYRCDATTKQWAWTWDAAKVTKKGCPLPKPPIPAQYQGKGDWRCDEGTKQWVWKWKDAPTPPPDEPTAARLVLAAGSHATFKVNTAADPKRASDARQWQHGAVTVPTGPKTTVRLPNGQTGTLVKIKSGPQQGRWIRPTAGTWTAGS